MTIVVDPSVPDSAFADAALKALQEICPCKGMSVDSSSGTLILDPRSPRCSCYQDHRAGCNLVFDLVSATAKILIVKSNGDPDYLAGILNWNEAGFEDGEDVDGGYERPPFVGLAHELVHAWAEIDGQSGTDVYDEIRAVCGENQIRQESGLPLRRGYESEMDDIPMAYCKAQALFLDTSVKEPCTEVQRVTPGAILANILKAVRKWILAIIRLLGRPRPRPRPPNPAVEFGTGGLSFDELLAGPPEPPVILGKRVRTARLTRDRALQRQQLALFAAAFDAAENAILVEAPAVVGAYRALLIIQGGSSVKLVTNLVRRDDPTYWIGGPGALVEYRYGAGLAADVGRRIAATSVAPTIAGSDKAVDGTVRFLTLKKGPDIRRAALYHYRFRGLDHSRFPEESDPGFASWRTVSEAHQIWRDLLQYPPESVHILAAGPR